MKKRAISELVAILIVVTILVGVAIAVALMTGSFVQRIKPSGGGLVITGATAKKVSNNRAVITLSLQNTGSETIRITSISVYDSSGSALAVSTGAMPTQLMPNQVATVGITVSASSQIPDYSSISLLVSYVTVTNTVGSVSQAIIVEPAT